MLHINDNADLSRLTTFGVEAWCGRLVDYTSAADDLPAIGRRGWFDDYIHIGEGANLLFTGPFGGTVIRSLDKSAVFERVAGGAPGSWRLTAAGGITVDACAAMACERGLWGLENLSAIPGMTGGAVVQNIGAYGVELKDVVESVEVYDISDGCFKTMRPAECEFGYRSSVFKRPDMRRRFIVTAASYLLSETPLPRLGYGHLREAVEQQCAAGRALSPGLVREVVIATREAKLPSPSLTGSAGSFFKNPVMPPAAFEQLRSRAISLWGAGTEVPHYLLPDGDVKVPAAWLIDRCGWKGRRRGGAAVWERQPLVLVNLTGTATAADVIALMHDIVDDVASRLGVTLTPEVEII